MADTPGTESILSLEYVIRSFESKRIRFPLLPPSAATTPKLPSAARNICAELKDFVPFDAYRMGWLLCSTE